MSRLNEYIKMIGNGIANFDKVVEGLTSAVKMRYGALPEDEQEEIIRRRLICHSCPLVSHNAPTSQEYLKLYGKHYKTDREDEHCSCCSCPIESKSSSLSSSCGIKTYNEEHPDNKQELKWDVYKK